MNIKNCFSVRTVRKKILMVSKLAGILLIISYVLSSWLPVDEDMAFLLWMVFVVVLVLLIDYLMGRFISEPLAKLSQSAQRMAQLDFSAPCVIETKDEFAALGENLNTMAHDLRQALSQLRDANVQLEEEVMRGRRLLAERKALVDDLSHEMKTPLGVIRAYAEGLQDETDDVKRKHYADVIIDETARMSDLITTLLDLSALENGAVKLQAERFDFVEFVETIAGRLLVDAPDANYELQYILPEEPVYVWSDRKRMEQVLDNLMMNAKCHVREGGLLRLVVKERDGLLTFSIYNQGATISAEELSKIWTKFYRGAQSAYTGSGLGLAIVAQILTMQGFSYGACNQEDGVLFYFSLPSVQ